MSYFEKYLESLPQSSRPWIHLKSGVLDELSEELAQRDGRTLILADQTTVTAPGMSVSFHRLLEKCRSNTGSSSLLLYELHQNPEPEYELACTIGKFANEKRCNLILALGSGVISDLGKQASMEAGIPNWTVMTAASVDAFTSGTAAMRIEGYHQSIPTRAASRIYCDLNILKAAPRKMHLSGLGDLAAKYIAAADWEMSGLITGEGFYPRDAGFSEGSATLALQHLEGALDGTTDGLRFLADAVLTSGLIMQFTRSSRPASSTEHILAHFWEVQGLVGNFSWDLHGVLVAGAAEIITGVYSGLLDLLDKKVFNFKRAEKVIEHERKGDCFAGLKGKALQKARDETALRDLSPAGLKKRQKTIEEVVPDLNRIYRHRISAAGTALESLQAAGLPLKLSILGIPRKRGFAGLKNIRYLRNRYSLIDLCWEAGLDREVREIFQTAYSRSW